MASIGRAFHRSIMNVLKGFIEELKKQSRKDYGIYYIVERIYKDIEIIEKTKPPILPTQRYLKAVDYLVHNIVKFKNIFNEYINNKISLEELRRGLSEYEDAMKLYIDIAEAERIKTQLYILVPHITLSFVIIYLVLSAPTILGYIIAPTILLIAGIIASYIHMMMGHIVNIIAALSLLVNLHTIYDVVATRISLLMIFMLTVFSIIISLMYIHIVYILSSKKSIELLTKSLTNIMYHSQPRTYSKGTISVMRGDKRSSQKVEEKPKDEYQELVKIYKKLYGGIGEAYLKYRLTLMIIQGIPRDEAIKRLYSEVKDFKVYEK